MLYKGDTLYLDWLEDGIAELVFDTPGSVNKQMCIRDSHQAVSQTLLTRPPLVSKAASCFLLPFDLHVLGLRRYLRIRQISW